MVKTKKPIIRKKYFDKYIPQFVINFILPKIISGKMEHSSRVYSKNRNFLLNIVKASMESLGVEKTDYDKEIVNYECKIKIHNDNFIKLKMKVSFEIKLKTIFQYDRGVDETNFNRLTFDLFYESDLYMNCKNNYYNLELFVSSINPYYKLLSSDALFNTTYKSDCIKVANFRNETNKIDNGKNDYEGFCDEILKEIYFQIYRKMDIRRNIKYSKRIYNTGIKSDFDPNSKEKNTLLWFSTISLVVIFILLLIYAPH